MIFDAVWTECFAFFCIGCPVIPMKVMFETSGIVGSDEITVMAVETLTVRGRLYESVGCCLASGKFYVTGCATGTVPCFRILISAVVDMATQTAASEHVFGQGELTAYFLMLGNGNK